MGYYWFSVCLTADRVRLSPRDKLLLNDFVVLGVIDLSVILDIICQYWRKSPVRSGTVG
jgi:hypothetical protein